MARFLLLTASFLCLILCAPQDATALIIDSFDNVQISTPATVVDSSLDATFTTDASESPTSPDTTFSTREIAASLDTTAFGTGGEMVEVDVGVTSAGLFTFSEFVDFGTFNLSDGAGRIRYSGTTLFMAAQTHLALTGRNASTVGPANSVSVRVTFTDADLATMFHTYSFARSSSFSTQIVPYSIFSGFGGFDFENVTGIELLIFDTPDTVLSSAAVFELDLIESLPEPTSAVMAILGAIGLAGYGARGRRRVR